MTATASRLVVLETHPVQYHAPVYRILATRGIEVTVLYGSDCSVVGYRDPGFQQVFAWQRDLLAGYQAEFLGTSKEGADQPERASTTGLAERLRELRPDAVLVTGYSPSFYRRALRAAFGSRRPVLLRAETSEQGKPRPWLKRQARDAWLRRLYARCAALLYIGQRSREHYERLGVPQHKLFFSPYAIDASPFHDDEEARALLRPRLRAEFNLAPDRIVLLYSGKLIPRKAPLRLIEAAAALPPELRSRSALIYLGDGGLRNAVERAARRSGLPALVTGFINQDGLSPYYHAADLLVVPSEWETWGLIVNDALHHGLPCVVSSGVDCHPDLIQPGATGLVYDHATEGALVRALEQGIELTGRADIRAACRTLVGRYSLEAAADGVARALMQVSSSAHA